MCLIIHKPDPDTVIPYHIIDNAEFTNPDGFGIVYTDTMEVLYTLDYDEAYDLINAQRPLVAHYRYATRGNKGIDNCHPFLIHPSQYLFSNGTVANLGDNKMTDTEEVCQILKGIPEVHWADILSFTDTRFCIVTDGHVERYGTWYERGGAWYSKNNCFASYCSTKGYYSYDKHFTKTGSYAVDAVEPTDTYEDDYDSHPLDLDKLDEEAWKQQAYDDLYPWDDVDYVAVYGTLKKDKGNHQYYLQGQEFVGHGITVNKYPLVEEHGLPYVYDKPNLGHNVSVEVYKVDDVAQYSLDRLEGHPTHYQRKLTTIELDKGGMVTAWLYFNASKIINNNLNMLQTY